MKEYEFKSILDDIIATSQEDLDKRDYGYYFEVYLNCHRKLQNKHKDLPYGAEKEIPNQELFSGSQQHFFTSSNEFKYIPTTKLLTTLFDKEKYVSHQRNLKQFIEAGLQVKKVHRTLKFSQSHRLGKSIDYNKRMRTKANNDFEKDFYKLMNISVFAKTHTHTHTHTHTLTHCETWGVKFKTHTIFTAKVCLLACIIVLAVIFTPHWTAHSESDSYMLIPSTEMEGRGSRGRGVREIEGGKRKGEKREGSEREWEKSGLERGRAVGERGWIG